MPRRRRMLRGRSRTYWNKRLDDLFRAVLMSKHGAVQVENASGKSWHWRGACRWCEKQRRLYVSHIKPKGTYTSMRWDEDNAFALCYHCHMHVWHKDPFKAQYFAQGVLGEDRYGRLMLRAGSGGKARIDYNLKELALVLRVKQVAPAGVLGLSLELDA